MTIGEMIEKLSKYDPSLELKFGAEIWAKTLGSPYVAYCGELNIDEIKDYAEINCFNFPTQGIVIRMKQAGGGQ